MAEKKKKAAVKKEKVAPRFFHGYDVKWLKFEAGVSHPDYHFVAEYEKEFGEIK